MQVKVVKWGNSGAVRLPAGVLKELNVALGARLELKTQGGKIILAPAQREYRLETMLAGITEQNRHAPVNLGDAVGRDSCEALGAWSVMPDGIVRAKTKSLLKLAGMLRACKGKRVPIEDMNPWR